uniref:Uncharacterized protein n=1 Tax=viral metagenome TaxID=1070528 RepID=A0A6C0HA89_9ZZZZ
MSTSNQSNTSEIDKKKQETKPDQINFKNTYNYGVYLFRQLITLAIIIGVGTGIVYSNKAFLSSVVPVNTKYFPYTNIIPDTDNSNTPLQTSINNVKLGGDKNYSTKLEFSKEENDKILESGLFGYLRNMKYKNAFLLYFCSVLQDILATNLQLNKTFYKLFGSIFTESMNIFIAPVIFVFWCILMFFINFANIILRLFTNLKWLFSTRESSTKASLFSNPIGYFTSMFSSSDEIYNDDDGPKNWKPGNIWSGMNILTTIIYIILIILFTIFAGFVFVYPFISVATIIYCFSLPLFMKANDVKTYNKPTQYSFKNAIADVLKYKSQLIMLILSYYIISGAHTYFGNTVTAISFVIFLIMFFFTPLFESYKLNYKDNLTPGIIPEAQAVPINTPVVDAVPIPIEGAPEFTVDTQNTIEAAHLSVSSPENEFDKKISGGKKRRS